MNSPSLEILTRKQHRATMRASALRYRTLISPGHFAFVGPTAYAQMIECAASAVENAIFYRKLADNQGGAA